MPLNLSHLDKGVTHMQAVNSSTPSFNQPVWCLTRFPPTALSNEKSILIFLPSRLQSLPAKNNDFRIISVLWRNLLCPFPLCLCLNSNNLPQYRSNFSHSGSLKLLLFSHLSGRCELTAVWPQVTGNWDNIGGNRGLPRVQHCVCVFVMTRYALAHARLAPSAWSGFNWMISALLACAVSVV